MRKILHRIAASDLKILRLTCRHRIIAGDGDKTCGTVVEIPLERLEVVKACPVCENPFRDIKDKTADPFLLLGKVLAGLSNLTRVELAFVLSDDSGNSQATLPAI